MASQLAILHSKLASQVQLPCLSSNRIRISAMAVPQPSSLSLSSSSSSSGRRLWNFPTTTTRLSNMAVKTHLPLVSPHDHLANFAVLFFAGAIGIWSEETKIGRALSGALVATLLGLAANNLGIIASNASSFPIVMDFLLPLAVHLLLFRADLNHVLNPTAALFPALFLGSGMDEKIEYNNNKKLSPLQFATSHAVSFSICKVGFYLSKCLRIQGSSLPVITVVTVVLVTIFPEPFAWLAPSGEAMAMILMQLSVHLVITIGLGKLLRFDLKSLLIASNAIIGDPTTACMIATTKSWSSMLIPRVFIGIFGVPIGMFLTTWLGMLYVAYR